MTTNMNVDDAREVDNQLRSIFDAWDTGLTNWVDETRKLFLLMDFEYENALVSLSPTPTGIRLPSEAHHIAHGDGIEILCISLPKIDDPDKQWMNHRVNKREADAAFKLIESQISADILIAFMNPEGSELNIIYPTYQGRRVILRRMRANRDRPNRTAAQQISGIWRSRGESGITTHEALMNAFDVEPVTTEFFDKYKVLFDEALTLITGFPTTETGESQKHLFTQILFNRLLFIYFISRKGWMLYQGDQDYLNAIWRVHTSDPVSSENFYKSRLKVLFDKGLNNPKAANLKLDDPAVWKTIGDVPFLNGGLFEEKDIPSSINVPDSVIEKIFTELFDRFNFTVTESTPFDIEVAVDPEMLGKVFEELVTERHKTGSFYTPRTIVSFMGREALKGYLNSLEIPGNEADIIEFIDNKDVKSILNKDQILPLMSALQRVKVVDPACGSGAYLLGMMQVLVELQLALAESDLLKDPRNLYQFKLSIIQQNIYGADIDSFAVSTAMLRLWLSLSIEYDGNRPPPLPNLDFKIVCGDSLNGPDPTPYNYQDMFRSTVNDFADEIADLKDIYMGAFGQQRIDAKNNLRAAHDLLAEELGSVYTSSGAIDWRIEFAEVLSRDGFDIVLANPPYEVVSDKSLRRLFEEGIYGRMNLYGLFIQRSLQLLGEGGQLVFINPKTLLTDKYFQALRKLIKKKSELGRVVLIEDRHNTFAQVLQECILLFLTKKQDPRLTYKVNTQSVVRPSDLDTADSYFSIDSEKVLLNERFDHAFYIGARNQDYIILDKMLANGVILKKHGLSARTGNIQFDKYRQFALPNPEEMACRLLWSENVQRYAYRLSNQRNGKEWLNPEVKKIVPPTIRSYGVLTQRTTSPEQPRRIIATIVDSVEFSEAGVYSENGTNFIDCSETDRTIALLTLATLNSTPFEFLFRLLNSNNHVSMGELNYMPFPDFSHIHNTSLKIADLVEDLVSINGVDCEINLKERAMSLDREIDELICEIYGLGRTEMDHMLSRLTPLEENYN